MIVTNKNCIIKERERKKKKDLSETFHGIVTKNFICSIIFLTLILELK